MSDKQMAAVAKILAMSVGVTGVSSKTPEELIAEFSKVYNSLPPDKAAELSKFVAYAKRTGIQIPDADAHTHPGHSLGATDTTNRHLKVRHATEAVVDERKISNSVEIVMIDGKPVVKHIKPKPKKADPLDPVSEKTASEEEILDDLENNFNHHFGDVDKEVDDVDDVSDLYDADEVEVVDKDGNVVKQSAESVKIKDADVNVEMARSAPGHEELSDLHKELVEKAHAEGKRYVSIYPAIQPMIDAYHSSLKKANESFEQVDETISRAERLKRKIRFAMHASTRERKLQIALKRVSSQSTIIHRARVKAILLIKAKIAKKPLDQLSIPEKERLERIIETRRNLVNRLAVKLAPKIRKLEQTRLSHHSFTQQ